MFCEHCGKEVSEKAVVCQGCGASVATHGTGPGASSRMASTESAGSGNGSIVALAIASLLLFLPSRLFFLFHETIRRFKKEWYYDFLRKHETAFDNTNIILTIFTIISFILLCYAVIKLATKHK